MGRHLAQFNPLAISPHIHTHTLPPGSILVPASGLVLQGATGFMLSASSDGLAQQTQTTPLPPDPLPNPLPGNRSFTANLQALVRTRGWEFYSYFQPLGLGYRLIARMHTIVQITQLLMTSV